MPKRTSPRDVAHIDVAADLDEVVVLRDGEVVEQGESAGIFAGASHPDTRALIEAVPHFGGPEAG